MRFVNHSCEPNYYLFEVHNRNQTAVLVYAIDDVESGSEVTVGYGGPLWFDCKCGLQSCVGGTGRLPSSFP